MKIRMVVIVGGAALLLSAVIAVVVASCNRRQPASPPGVPVVVPTDKVCVKAVARKAELEAEGEIVAASGAVAIVCGEDAATAGRYEARSDALRSISRRTDLPNGDVAALMAYLRAQDGALRAERVAALKNDVMNLLRLQEPPPKGLAETLMGMVEGKSSDCGGGHGVPALPWNTVHPPVVIDYCIQHLGAMIDEIDEKGRLRVRAVLAKAAKRTKLPYAGTALYSLAEDARATPF